MKKINILLMLVLAFACQFSVSGRNLNEGVVTDNIVGCKQTKLLYMVNGNYESFSFLPIDSYNKDLYDLQCSTFGLGTSSIIPILIGRSIGFNVITNSKSEVTSFRFVEPKTSEFSRGWYSNFTKVNARKVNKGFIVFNFGNSILYNVMSNDPWYVIDCGQICEDDIVSISSSPSIARKQTWIYNPTSFDIDVLDIEFYEEDGVTPYDTYNDASYHWLIIDGTKNKYDLSSTTTFINNKRIVYQQIDSNINRIVRYDDAITPVKRNETIWAKHSTIQLQGISRNIVVKFVPKK